LSYMILTDNGHIVISKFIRGLRKEKLRDPIIAIRAQTFDRSLTLAIQDKDSGKLSNDDFLNGDSDEDIYKSTDEKGAPEFHNVTPEELDEYLSKELHLPRGGSMVYGRVVSRKRDGTGIPIGLRHNNPILDTRQYEVEFPDGSIDVFSANVIAENLHQQVEPETQEHAMFRGIIDHLRKGDDTGGAGISTKGWEIYV
jgi:hypothetical protein